MKNEDKKSGDPVHIKTSAKIPVPPIVIDNQGGGMYTWPQAESQFWCSGQGSQSNPYIIQDIIINGRMESGVEIRNSNVYFRIINCEIYNMGDDFFDAGIKLNNTQNGELINDIISNNNYYGIILDNSHHNTLKGNTIENNNFNGIILGESNYNTLSGNSFRDNIDAGLYSFNSDHNTISGNTFDSNDDNGLHFYYSDHNKIQGNTIKNHIMIGILIENSNYNTVLGNIFANNGKDIEEITSLGNIFEEVDGDEDDDDDEKNANEEAIPGYDIYIFTGTILITSIILAKKRFKQHKMKI